MSAPSELYSRAADVGITKPTHEWLCTEARYVAEMIKQGGSDYSDSPDRGRKLLVDCQRFVRENCLVNRGARSAQVVSENKFCEHGNRIGDFCSGCEQQRMG